MRVEVVVENENALERHVWGFTYLTGQHQLRLIWESQESRPSKRHKWRQDSSWDAYRRERDNTIKPSLPDQVIHQALRQFTSELTVTLWPDKVRDYV